MSKALVTIEYTVAVDYHAGDYAMLHGNGGSSAVDYNTPLDETQYELLPDKAGIYGWGHAPWGNFGWGYCHSLDTPGWGYMPWGYFPWGYGTCTVRAQVTVEGCGDYKFAFKCYDSLGNAHVGTPDEVEVHIHIAPEAPAGLKKNSYNKDTDVLVLDVAA